MNSQGKEGPDDGDSMCKGPAGKVTGSKEACVAGKGLRSGESGGRIHRESCGLGEATGLAAGGLGAET